tara:strand:+ start:3544 stop:4245 length:702 start_codon:yes stop_codon:yes gene_type:complete
VKINKNITTYTCALIASLSLLVALPSSAALTQMSFIVEDETDCGANGYFHNEDSTESGFSACEIFYQTTTNSVEYLNVGANVIDKYDAETELWESEDGSDFDLSFNKKNPEKRGSWSKASGVTDFPEVRFWIAKAGNAFQLFWMVEDNTESTNACNPYSYTLECLNLAQVVDQGSWAVPSKNGLSHLTFFGGTNETTCTENCPVTVPEPQTIMLLALAILGLVARKRSTVKNS